MRNLKIVLFLVLFAPLIAGCGGGKSSPASQSLGSASFDVEWPNRADPSSVQSVQIVISDGSTVLATRIVERSPEDGQSATTFGSLPTGDLIAAITAYPEAGAVGIPIAEASTAVNVLPGQNAFLNVSILGNVDSLGVTPASPSLGVSETVQLTATPRNLNGHVVLVAPGSITWESANPAVAAVDSDGTVTGVAPGVAEITATETTSGLRAVAEVSVTRALWTVLVYMAADNDLERYAIDDINEMETVGSTGRVRVVVQVDRAPGYDSSNGNWETTRRYLISRDSDTSVINSELIADLGELDMAAPETLADFVDWGAHAYPADRYLLILWDHGRGWQTRSPLTLTPEREVKAIHVDSTSNSEMTLGDLEESFDRINVHPDVVLFDACLMGMLEVAYALRAEADIMVASEENIPTEGQAYQELLSRMTLDPGMSPEELSRTIVDEYMDYYTARYTSTYTYSAVLLDSVDQVVLAADRLAGAILVNLAAARLGVRLAQQETQHYDFDKLKYTYYKDLYHFASRANASVSVPEVRSAAQDVTSAVSSAVLYQRNSGGKVANSFGISIYLPDPDTMLSEYRTLSFSQATQWDEFVALY